MPWNLIYLTTYEASKRKVYDWKARQLDNKNRLRQLHQAKHNIYAAPTQLEILPGWAYPLCSSSCAAFAAVLTHPIDVVKTRLQVMSARSGNSQGAFTVARELWETQGISGFARGLGARVVTMSVGTSISWFVYETVKKRLQTY